MSRPGHKFVELRVKVSDLDLSHMGHWAEIRSNSRSYFGRLTAVERSESGALITFEGEEGAFQLQLDEELYFIGAPRGGNVY